MPVSGVKNVYAYRNKWRAMVYVDGAARYGPERRTIDEAAVDATPMREEQRRAKIARRQQQASDFVAVRTKHAEEMEANMDMFRDNQAKDGLSRAFVKLALQGSSVVAVDGVEYSCLLYTSPSPRDS